LTISIAYGNVSEVQLNSKSEKFTVVIKFDTALPAKLNLNKAHLVKVISMETKYPATPEKNIFYEKCKNWKITAQNLNKIITNFRQVSSEFQYLSHSVMPCGIKGEIIIDKIKYVYMINAGATLILFRGSAEYYYVYTGKNWRKYFITSVEKKEKKCFQISSLAIH
jgi:hypothetical protein